MREIASSSSGESWESERQSATVYRARAEADDYIRTVAGGSSSAQEITSAKALLDDGAITQGEYDRLKAKALA